MRLRLSFRPYASAANNPNVFEKTLTQPGRDTRNITKIPNTRIHGTKVDLIAILISVFPQTLGKDVRFMFCMIWKIQLKVRKIRSQAYPCCGKNRNFRTKKIKVKEIYIIMLALTRLELFILLYNYIF